MADSQTEMEWICDELGHNGKMAQLKELRRQLCWVEGGYLKQVRKEEKNAIKKAKILKNKIRKLEQKL